MKSFPGIFISHQSALNIWKHIDPNQIYRLQKYSRIAIPTQLPSVAESQSARKNVAWIAGEQPSNSAQPLHILTATKSHSPNSKEYTSHYSTHRFRNTDFYEIAPDTFISSPELTLAQVANSVSLFELLELAYEFCGTYRTIEQTYIWSPNFPNQMDSSQSSKRQTAYNATQITSADKISNFCKSHAGLAGVKKLKWASKYVVDMSASPMETKLAILLSIPARYGGAGLTNPNMNYPVLLSESGQTLTGKKSLFCDIYWPSHKLDIEYQSSEFHNNPGNRQADLARINALQNEGITVMQISYNQLTSIEKITTLQQAVRRKCKIRNQRPSKDTAVFSLMHSLGLF